MIRNGKIRILEDIIVDKKLPKYKVETKKVDGFNVVGGNDNTPNIIQNNNDNGLNYLEYVNKNAPTLMNKFKIWLYKKLYSKIFEHQKQKKSINIDVIKFFEDVKLNFNELDKQKIDNVLNKYQLTLKNAEANNQISLIETINEYAETLKNELLLSTSEFNKYLTEKDVVNFHSKASVHEKYKTGLCLTYIKNFVKVIPNEITELKKKADKIKVFDNYVILHYDPSGKAVKDTKKEKKRKKDPILFGLIKGSKKLYYIGDWVDDYCDLTLDVIIEKIGKEASVINEETIKNNIDKL